MSEYSEVIKNMVDNILAGSNVEAQDTVNTLLANKVTDALADKKKELATTIYNREEE
jgi:hypothetical protein